MNTDFHGRKRRGSTVARKGTKKRKKPAGEIEKFSSQPAHKLGYCGTKKYAGFTHRSASITWDANSIGSSLGCGRAAVDGRRGLSVGEEEGLGGSSGFGAGG